VAQSTCPSMSEENKRYFHFLVGRKRERQRVSFLCRPKGVGAVLKHQRTLYRRGRTCSLKCTRTGRIGGEEESQYFLQVLSQKPGGEKERRGTGRSPLKPLKKESAVSPWRKNAFLYTQRRPGDIPLPVRKSSEERRVPAARIERVSLLTKKKKAATDLAIAKGESLSPSPCTSSGKRKAEPPRKEGKHCPGKKRLRRIFPQGCKKIGGHPIPRKGDASLSGGKGHRSMRPVRGDQKASQKNSTLFAQRAAYSVKNLS